MPFTKAALARHWDRLSLSGIGEWRGAWTRYQMADGRLQASPAFSAVCALTTGVCTTSEEPSAIEQTNTYYEEGANVAPRVVTMPVLTADSFGELPLKKNSLIVLPDDAALVWSTLDFAAPPPPPVAAGAAAPPRIAAVELVCRFRSNRARVVLLYFGDGGVATDGATTWRLQKLTSIRDSCQAGPYDAPSFPTSEHPSFWAGQPASSEGWIWEVKEVGVAAAAGGWASELPETKTSGSLDGTLADQLDAAGARTDLPEPDLLVHAPDALRFGGENGARGETEISLTWSAEKDVCLRASVVIDAQGRLSAARSSYWRHLHWHAAK